MSDLKTRAEALVSQVAELTGAIYDSRLAIPYVYDAMRAVQQEEREACAVLADEYSVCYPQTYSVSDRAYAIYKTVASIAAAIRARGDHD